MRRRAGGRHEVVELFLRSPFRRFPVLSGTRLVGLISRRDVMRAVPAALVKGRAAPPQVAAPACALWPMTLGPWLFEDLVRSAGTMKELTRTEAIDALRAALLEVAGDEHSICKVARDKNLFCRGFAQWKLHELKAQYPQITRSRPRLTRAAMEDLADRWQMARQFVTGEHLACDVQLHEGAHQTCRGWDEFDDAQLEQFHKDLCGEKLRITAPDQAGDAR
jgi:hypothetical protein